MVVTVVTCFKLTHLHRFEQFLTGTDEAFFKGRVLRTADCDVVS